MDIRKKHFYAYAVFMIYAAPQMFVVSYVQGLRYRPLKFAESTGKVCGIVLKAQGIVCKKLAVSSAVYLKTGFGTFDSDFVIMTMLLIYDGNSENGVHM